MSLRNYLPRLTGGTFLTLIKHSTYTKQSARALKSGKSDPMSQIHILQWLINLADKTQPKKPDEKSFSPKCSDYIRCEDISSPTYLPFNINDEKNAVETFINDITYEKNKTCIRANEFTNHFIATNGLLKNKLAYSLLTIIKEDTAINESEIIYINSINGDRTKAQLENITEIDLSSLILGCWYYILSKQIKNTDGKETIQAWHTYGTPNARGTWNCDLFKEFTSLNIDFIETDFNKNSENAATAIFFDTNEQDFNDNNEEEIKGKNTNKNNGSSKDAKILNQRIINNYGKGKYFEHIENAYFNDDED